MKEHKIRLPIQLREASLQQSAGDPTVFDVIFTTGAAVRRFDFWSGEEYDEELLVDSGSIRLERLNSGAAPVLNTHSATDLNDVIGVVLPGSARIENGIGRASLKLYDGPDNQSIIAKIQQGIVRNVSVGYRVHTYEISESDGVIPLYRASDWEPYEISLVPIGADPGAGMRSAGLNHSCIIKRTINQNQGEETMSDKLLEDKQNNPAPEKETEGGAEKAKEEGIKEELSRSSEIRNIVRAVGLEENVADDLIGRRVSIDNARKEVIDAVARKSKEGGETISHIKVTGDDPLIRQRTFVENALLHRYKPETYKLDDESRQYRGLSLIEISRDLLEQRGIKTRGLSKQQVATLALGLETRGGYMGTSDFANVLANVANKTLRDSYESSPQTFKLFTKQKNASDFKQISRTQLSDAPAFEKVNESGEFKRGQMSDAAEGYKLATYGKIVAITRQVIINDDLNAFTDIPAKMGSAAADLESDTVWGIITANAALADGIALFHANHGNLTGSGTTISIASLGVGRTAVRLQKSIQKRPLNLQTDFLIIPAALETVAQQYTVQTNILYTKGSDFNPFANTLKPVVEPRLDANSATSWYLAASPSRVDTIEYAYLEGQEGAYLESRVGFDVDGVEIKGRLDFAAKAIDYRGLYKNVGA